MKMTTRRGVNYAIDLISPGRAWFHRWTPMWHEGRGPYVSMGFWRIGIYRGY
jgi:hypothetical protein